MKQPHAEDDDNNDSIDFNHVYEYSQWIKLKTLQELRMLSRSLSDCESLLLVMIQVSQFVSSSQLCH